jgi:hypothetical protein
MLPTAGLGEVVPDSVCNKGTDSERKQELGLEHVSQHWAAEKMSKS